MENYTPRDFGFARVGIAIPKVKVADPKFNAGEICFLIDKAKKVMLMFCYFRNYVLQVIPQPIFFSRKFYWKRRERR